MKKNHTNKNQLALLLFAAFFLAALLLMSLPFFSFRSTVFEKKSANTEVGSEKYLAARALAEEAALPYGEKGTISEEITQRTNSKGVTSTLVTFRVELKEEKSGFQLLSSSLRPAATLRATALLSLIAFALVLLSFLLSRLPRRPRGLRLMRLLAAWLLLAALVLLPVLSMEMTYVLNRQIRLAVKDGSQASIAQTMQAAGDLLFGGVAAENREALLTKLSYSARPALFLLMLPLLSMALCAVYLVKGEIRSSLAKGFLYLFIIALCVLILYPYYTMLVVGLRSNAETTDMEFRHLFPVKWMWSNISDILQRGVPRYLANSVLMSVGATSIALLCGIPAAYAMARMRFRGKKAFLGFIIMSQMFSPVVLLVGISWLMNAIRLNDNLTGLMLINAAFNQAFAIWLLRGTFVAISPEMEQASRIDGCSTVGSLIRILIPMAAPGIVTTLIFIFINAWNEYTISTVLISTAVKRPITVGITQFSSYTMIEWQYLFAAALIATIPVVILFLTIEKHLVSGLTSGGVKG